MKKCTKTTSYSAVQRTSAIRGRNSHWRHLEGGKDSQTTGVVSPSRESPSSPNEPLKRIL